jgi:hypothetical protein
MKIFAVLLLTILLIPNIAYAIYDPTEGRWITRDPIQEQGGLNLYAYCGNNPINAVDPMGRQSVPVSLMDALASGQVDEVASAIRLMGGDLAGSGPGAMSAEEAETAAQNAQTFIDLSKAVTSGGMRKAAFDFAQTVGKCSSMSQSQKLQVLKLGLRILQTFAKQAGRPFTFSASNFAAVPGAPAGLLGFTGAGSGAVPVYAVDAAGNTWFGTIQELLTDTGAWRGVAPIPMGP